MISHNLKKILEKIESFFFNDSYQAIGIDIGTDSLKIAEIYWRDGRPILRSTGIIDLPANIIEDGSITDSETLTELIRQVINVSGTTAKEVVMAVGGLNIFLREVMFPLMDESELREAIKWDMEKYIPFAPDSYFFDFAVIGTARSGLELKVLLAAAPQEIVNSVTDIVKNVGLQPVAVGAEPLAIIRTLAKAENSLIIDIGGQATQLIIFQNGSPSITRMIPIGGHHFTGIVMRSLELDYNEAEQLKKYQKGLLPQVDSPGEQSDLHLRMDNLVGELTREIRRTIEYYHTQNKEAVIDKMYLSGGGAKLDNIIQYIEKYLDRQVIMLDPLAGIDVAPSFDKKYLHDMASQLAVAIGLALGGGAI